LVDGDVILADHDGKSEVLTLKVKKKKSQKEPKDQGQ